MIQRIYFFTKVLLRTLLNNKERKKDIVEHCTKTIIKVFSYKELKKKKRQWFFFWGGGEGEKNRP